MDTSYGSNNSQETPNEESIQTSTGRKGIEDEEHLMKLYRLVQKGDWEPVDHLLRLHPDALTTRVTWDGNTALHVTALFGQVKIAEELIRMTNDPRDLELENENGATALVLAAATGITEIAMPLVRKNPALVRIKNSNGDIPVIVAAQSGHLDMTRFLYSKTQHEDLDPKTSSNNQGAKLLQNCIVAKFYEIALDLVRRFPDLAIVKLSKPPGGTLNTLATRNSTFPSGNRFVFWQRWIYSCMPKHPYPPNIHKENQENTADIEAGSETPTNQENISTQAHSHLYGQMWDFLKKIQVPCIKHIRDTKMKHDQALWLLDCIRQGLSTLNHSQLQKNTELLEATFDAIKHGNFEFVKEMLAVYPDIVWFVDHDKRNILFLAVLHREEKIFNLLQKLGPVKNPIAARLAKNGNTLLHHAAMLSPSSHLEGISGAALQMQRELQWFEEVEKVVQPSYREMKNTDGQTARALFTSEHKELRKEGEKWMKDTATSYTLAVALVATVMFAAAFTVPGGFNNNGDPVYLHSNSFIIFVLSDALSLFSSASSILTFLGILKSVYAEDDFLVSLPRKLMRGIFTLILSIVTMMLAFATTILIYLHHRSSWISIPIIALACIPVMFFVCPEVPLLYKICVSTYGPGIFETTSFWSPKTQIDTIAVPYQQREREDGDERQGERGKRNGGRPNPTTPLADCKTHAGGLPHHLMEKMKTKTKLTKTKLSMNT